MDPEALRALGRRFWYAWGAAMLGGAVVLVSATVLFLPEDAWVVATFGLLALTFAGFAVVSTTQGDRIDALGMAISAVGMTMVGVSAATGYPAATLWGGLGTAAFGSAIGMWADHGHRLRSALGS